VGTRRFAAQHRARSQGRLSLQLQPKGDSITSFRVSAANGALQFTGRFDAVGSPAAMVLPALKRAL
jgi:hypothetical protein